MTTSRIEAFRAMVAKNPANPLARFGLANEAYKERLFEEARENYEAYLAVSDDEGNAWGKLAAVLHALGRTEDARVAYQRGIDAARRFGHVGMVNDLEASLEELENE
jgi:tetratricopeptide (TPR) repeat protein